MSENCAGCRYSLATPDGRAITCRRYPPQLMVLPGAPSLANPNQPTVQVAGLLPTLAPDSWCGEFSLKVTQ